MASILCVHGIGQQLKGEEIVASEWCAALRDGLRVAGASSEELPGDADIAVTFYGDLFREEIKKGFESPFQLTDIDGDFEKDLVMAWFRVAVTASEPAELSISGAELKSSWQSSEAVQKLAIRLLRYRYFAALSERLFVGGLKQVRRYFMEAHLRHAVRQRLLSQLSTNTRLLIAHSLGSVVAYEALSETTSTAAPHFVTLGSPLGLPNLIFDRLQPAPIDGRGAWPQGARSWVNISDPHDIVAAVKQLAPLFIGVQDLQVSNEALAHDASPYLTAKATGIAILEALRA